MPDNSQQPDAPLIDLLARIIARRHVERHRASQQIAVDALVKHSAINPLTPEPNLAAKTRDKELQ